MTKDDRTPTQELAHFAAALRYEDLPPEVVEMARRCLTDWLGIAIAGSRQPLSPIVHTTIDQLGGHSQSTVIGLGKRTSAAQAALINGTFAHSIDYDDVHVNSGVHASAPVWAATLAMTQWRQASAADATAAFVAGYEVMVRIGLVVGLPMFKRGFHPTGTLGYFGATAAAGRLLRLDESRMAVAFGIAAGQAGGLVQVRGTMSKPFFAGHSAFGGVFSAMLAANGFESTADTIEAPQGVLATYAGDHQAGFAFADLGRRFELLNNGFKAYAACALAHPMIDGLLDIRCQIADLSQIAEIRVGLNPVSIDYLNRLEVATGLAGKFSLQYCAAVALIDGQVQESQFTAARASDPQLRPLAERVRMTSIESMPIDQSLVEVRMADGQTHRRHIEEVSGSPAKPMSPVDLTVKFKSLASMACSTERVDGLLERLGVWPATGVDDLLAMTVQPLCTD